mgnify:FL=1
MFGKGLGLFLAALLVCGCSRSGGEAEQVDQRSSLYDVDIEVNGDSMLYGLTCDGTGDSTVVIWPFVGEPITLNCIDAKQQGHIIGKPEIGDWIGVMRNPSDTLEATFVINLDQLKGTWTYPVMPVMRELQNMSRRMQRRMMASMPDSVKKTFLVPREYGFTLKRLSQAESVGRVMRTNTLEDDSPVTYPEVKNYVKWHVRNGQLLLVSAKRPAAASQSPDSVANPVIEVDTMDFVHLGEDSLILSLHGSTYGFHRKANAIVANAEATKAQTKIDQQKRIKETK